MKQFLDNFGAILGAATLVLLLFSVTHEFGYFLVIGASFQTFASTSDYFANATQWIPSTAIIMYVWLDWRAILGKRVFAPPISKHWRTWVIPGFFAAGLVTTFFFSSELVSIAVFFPLLYVWLVYGARLLPFEDRTEPVFQQARAALSVIPVVAMAAFFIGIERGKSALRQTTGPYAISMKNGEQRNRVLLRNFERGMLVRNVADQRIEFIRWDQIDEVSRFAAAKPADVSTACSWLRLNCPPVPPSP
ncbi:MULTISPECIES: hypothetical protein [Bradyrhizobium]|uniref:hypothetical protein n=1 Tax=Bradyrhizobium elkanii TaxID=29448 RepID=UPI0012BC3A5F|nr:hypothetical protein [Bradyrhizobium elkanii]